MDDELFLIELFIDSQSPLENSVAISCKPGEDVTTFYFRLYQWFTVTSSDGNPRNLLGSCEDSWETSLLLDLAINHLYKDMPTSRDLSRLAVGDVLSFYGNVCLLSIIYGKAHDCLYFNFKINQLSNEVYIYDGNMSLVMNRLYKGLVV